MRLAAVLKKLNSSAQREAWCNWNWVEPDWLLAHRHVLKVQQVENLLGYVAFTLDRTPSDAFVTR